MIHRVPKSLVSAAIALCLGGCQPVCVVDPSREALIAKLDIGMPYAEVRDVLVDATPRGGTAGPMLDGTDAWMVTENYKLASGEDLTLQYTVPGSTEADSPPPIENGILYTIPDRLNNPFEDEW